MDTLPLNGSWTLRKDGKGKAIPAMVPGDVHTDLLRNRIIPDPFYRDNELRTLWIGDTAWTYSKRFSVPAEILARARALLRFHGLDTLAEVHLNGVSLGATNNMFRVWEFDVTGKVKPEGNTLEVLFAAPMPYVRKKQQEMDLPTPQCVGHEEKGRPWLRKEQCNFGWDWGPVLVTSGIWRDVELVAFDTARLSDVHVRQEHGPDGAVRLKASVSAERVGTPGLRARLIVCRGERALNTNECVLAEGAGELSLDVPEPKLWWPNGMGEQPLYDVRVDLCDAAGVVIDSWQRRMGLRELRLRRQADQWGESFGFVVNGVPFFAKGANWIPIDAVLGRATPAMYRGLLQAAADTHMNMIRVWGGGIYEHDCFYDICDELGICIWQDFMFACSSYPTFEPGFLDNVRAEAEDNVRRIRHHACMALWCGNNELEQWVTKSDAQWPRMPPADYGKLFDELLPDVVRRLDPDRDYWPSSPHSSVGNRDDEDNQTNGDGHVWGVWHGRRPFEWYRTQMHRFCSEFGFQSFPEARTFRGYTAPGERNITGYIADLHQRSGAGNSAIMQYMLNWFRMPVGFENTVWLSQILHGLAMKYAVEHWRRNMPRCMGALYWQINDCWPVASWASIDYHGRWKALQYMAKRFYAPVLVSGVEDPKAGTVEVWLSNDRREAVSGTVRWTATTANGKRLASGQNKAAAAAGTSMKVDTLQLEKLLKRQTARDLLVWLEFVSGRETLSRNLVTFTTPKNMDLPDPGLSVRVAPAPEKGVYTVTLKARRPAFWLGLSLARTDSSFSDNFVCLQPGETFSLTVRPGRRLTLAQVRSQLRVFNPGTAHAEG